MVGTGVRPLAPPYRTYVPRTDTWRPTAVAPTRIHALLPRFGTRPVFNKRSNHPGHRRRPCVCDGSMLARAFIMCCCCGVPLQPYARVQSHHCAFRVQIEARDPGTVRRQLLRPLPSHARLSQSQESGTVQVQAGTRPHAHNGENAWARARPPATKALSFVLPRKAH